MRKGVSIGVSLAIGMAIFVLGVASTFLLLQGPLAPGGGFSTQVGAAADYALSTFQDNTEWTVYRLPVIVHSSHALNGEPLELRVPYPPSTDEPSILVMQDGQERRSQHSMDDNTTVVHADLSDGATILHIVYTDETGLADRTYNSDLVQGGNSTWNADLNVTVSSTGFSTIRFKDLDMLQDTASISASSTPQFSTGLLQTNISYDEADMKTVRVFDDSGQIRMTDRFTGETDWFFNLTSNFTEMYTSATDSTTSLSSSGIIFQGTTDFVDFYDVYGFGILAEDMFVNVSRDTASSRIEVRINVSDDAGRKDVLLEAHDGDYTAIFPRTTPSPYNVSLGAPVSVRGLSRSKAAALESNDYETVKTTLGLTGSEYNITVPDVFEKGRRVPGSTTVRTFNFPVATMERFANATVNDLRIRVWN